MEEQIEQAVLCALSPQVDPNMKAQVNDWQVDPVCVCVCVCVFIDHAWIGMMEAHETMW